MGEGWQGIRGEGSRPTTLSVPPVDVKKSLLARIVHGTRLPPRRQHADIAVSKPALRTVSTSSTPPACETTVRPPPSMRTRGYDPIRFFTGRVLLSVQPTGP
jgi:hypothetical protein